MIMYILCISNVYVNANSVLAYAHCLSVHLDPRAELMGDNLEVGVNHNEC